MATRKHVVASKAARFCLHVEELALGTGLGGLGGWLWAEIDTWGKPVTAPIAVYYAYNVCTALFAVLAIIGLLRPMHQRLGIRRGDKWGKS